MTILTSTLIISGAYPKANGDDALELSSTDISSSDEDDAKLPKSRNSRKKVQPTLNFHDVDWMFGTSFVLTGDSRS